MSGRERLRRLAPPFVLLLAVVALARSWPVAARFVPADDAALVAMLLRAAEWAAGAQLVVSLLDVLVWYGLVERRAGRPAPRLLRDVGAALVWVAAACLVAAEVFGWPVAGIVTTSGVAVAVLGFALRDVLAALFAGLALNAERPYRIGDWIEFEPHPPGASSRSAGSRPVP